MIFVFILRNRTRESKPCLLYTSTSIEHIGAGGQILVTSVPLYSNGEMDLIICVERDIKELSDLKEALDQQREINEQTKQQLAKFKLELENEKGDFIASSYKLLRVKENVKLVGCLLYTSRCV